MPDIRKEQERDELHRAIWAIADELRGSESEDNFAGLFDDIDVNSNKLWATDAGKSGGEFFTPQEVSELLARIAVAGKTEVNKVYEDTLVSPQHWDDEPFEVIVSNPPYSIKWEGDDNPVLINDPRFSPAGVLAPKSKADLAFIMHSLAWLATSGTAAIVCFPGIMYRGGAEKKIRQHLIDNNFIDCIAEIEVG